MLLFSGFYNKEKWKQSWNYLSYKNRVEKKKESILETVHLLKSKISITLHYYHSDKTFGVALNKIKPVITKDLTQIL